LPKGSPVIDAGLQRGLETLADELKVPRENVGFHELTTNFETAEVRLPRFGRH
jgi:hypothetical protein